MTEELLDQQAVVFKALADPFRLRILKMLPDTPDCHNGKNVNDLIEALGGSQPNMSHHLKILKQAGLVESEKECCSVYFYRHKTNFENVANFIHELKP